MQKEWYLRFAVVLMCIYFLPAVNSACSPQCPSVPPPQCTDVIQPSSTSLRKWVQELVKPSVHVPYSTKGKVDRYAVSIDSFKQLLHPDLPETQVYGYSGSYPGSTFEAKVGRPVKVTWKNNLPCKHILPTEFLAGNQTPPESAAVTHLHGGHTPADSDGNPLAWITKGERAKFFYPNKQLATTLWYHDHTLSRTRANVQAGLAGFYLLRDKNEARLGLPSGDFEIPIAIQDRVIQDDGQFFYPCIWQPEFFGDVAVVNGRVWPFLKVQARAYRFRFLNGCNSRFLSLFILNGPKIWQIGTDGGLLNKPVQVDTLTLGPGERADCIIDFYGFEGQSFVLNNNAATPFPGGGEDIPLPEIIRFDVSPEGGAQYPFKIPCLRKAARLPKNPLDLGYPYKIAKVRDLTLEEITVIGPSGSPQVIPTLTGRRFEDPPTETPRVNTVELWRLINLTPDTHPIHLHLTQFRLIERRPFDVDQYVSNATLVFTGPPVPPPANEVGWKDTIQANPGEVTTILAPFEDFTGDYVWHCHILEHEDNDMMRPLVVLPDNKCK